MKYFLVTISGKNGYSFTVATNDPAPSAIWTGAKALKLADEGDFDEASFDEITQAEYISYLN